MKAPQVRKPERSAIEWLLESDPSIRWQVMRDLTGALAEEVAAERARVATEGVGARLLAHGRMTMAFYAEDDVFVKPPGWRRELF